MGGFITKPEIISNKQFIIATYGIEFYMHCLIVPEATFLAMLIKFKKI